MTCDPETVGTSAGIAGRKMITLRRGERGGFAEWQIGNPGSRAHHPRCDVKECGIA